jgi:hypothetical protein
MRRTIAAVATAGAVTLAALVVWWAGPTSAQSQPPKETPATNGSARATATPLPIAQVILFSSGVGYFQREGEVEGSSRVDLTFPGTDVNDLLKSLVLQDGGGGRVSTISYDSPDPIEKTLKSFALDLTYNPSFGQLLNQARGEKVEVTLQQNSAAQPGTLTGVILGMESQRQPAGKDAFVEVEMLNLLCSEGIRSVPLSQVLRLRLLNPALEGELRRALEVLATRHDSQKKVVSLTFDGDGRRPVKVGYVVENPIWKTSYRLVLEDKGKAFLQGWAVVENTSDDDWKDVRMALVSGRPISFQMDLYQPLFIPRPTVEPELFASLRPPTFSGALTNPGQPMPPGVAGGLGNLGALGVQGGVNLGMVGGPQAWNPALLNGATSVNRYNLNFAFGAQFGQQGGGQFGQQGGGQLGQQAGMMGMQGQNSINGNFDNNSLPNNRLSYQELQQRRQQQVVAREKAKNLGSALAAIDLKQGVTSVAAADEVGDYFRYVIDHKVTLPRQKSALLPIINDSVEAKRVSIFNEGVQSKFPLLGLKFKNTSGQNLMQGPITVYEGSTYAGDARVLDLQPGEERLVAYAVDQGTEVKAEGESAPHQLVAVKVVKGVLRATHKLRDTKNYIVKNRSSQERTLIIEHPVRPDWKLVTPEKPSERSREVYRFEVKVPAGESVTHKVVEEQSRVDHVALNSSDDQTVRLFLNSRVSSPKVKAALEKAVALRATLGETQRELGQEQAQLKDITEDQGRLRANFERLPPSSAAYKRYLEKFDTQETEIEKLQAQIKKLQETQKGQQKQYEDYLASLSVE